MSVRLNHIIVSAKDAWASARFLAKVLGVDAGPAWGPFVSVQVDNGVTLDYVEADHMGADPNAIQPQHYAFLVGDMEFDAAMERLEQLGVAIYAGPGHAQPGAINHLYGGRGVYFNDPDGHVLELITAPSASIRRRLAAEISGALLGIHRNERQPYARSGRAAPRQRTRRAAESRSHGWQADR